MLLFHAVEGGGVSAHGARRLPVRSTELLPERRGRSWPTWAQRHIVLGLDLQGGSHLLLEVDTNAVRKDRLMRLDDVPRILRESRILFTGLAIHGNSVEVRITRESRHSRLHSRSCANFRSRWPAFWAAPDSAVSRSLRAAA